MNVTLRETRVASAFPRARVSPFALYYENLVNNVPDLQATLPLNGKKSHHKTTNPEFILKPDYLTSFELLHS